MALFNKMVPTSRADIAVSQTGGKGLPVVFLHGNSMCKEVFRDILAGPLGEAHRVIALDLPGHGASSDAHDPQATYTMPGYAEAVMETLEALDVRKAAVYGWSLGGHVALELIPRWEGLAGVMISGTPPVGKTPEAIQAGFKPIPQIGLAGKPDFTAEEVEMFAMATCGAHADQVVRDAIKRTDGRARAVMFASLFTGQASDQKALVETSPVPVAVVNGAEDPLLNVEYVGGLHYRNLWDKHCYVLRGAGHACFLDKPDAFTAILSRFAADMAKEAGNPSRMGKGPRIAVA